MGINSQHITGFAVGIGAAALGFFLYTRYQDKVDDFLRKQGIKVPERGTKNHSNMNFEELVSEKERLEDLIAEMEMAGEKLKEGQKKAKTQS
jgi:hypothetical protein